MDGGESTLDPLVLRRVRADLGEDGFSELLGIYLDESRRLLEQMRHGLETGDLATLRRGGHTLRSTSLLFGLSRLSHLMGEIERAPDSAARASLEQALKEAESEYANAVRLLQAPPPPREEDRSHWM